LRVEKLLVIYTFNIVQILTRR